MLTHFNSSSIYHLSKFLFNIILGYGLTRIAFMFLIGSYRYKKLLHIMDLRKDFFFSYSYNIMSSLQKNLCDNETGQVPDDTMFVWNEYLTREIHSNLGSTLWTVALVYGFFKQVCKV